MINEEKITMKGAVEVIIDFDNGEREVQYHHNTVLRNAKYAAVQSLINNIGEIFEYYVDAIIFGTNGTVGGVPKVVEDLRNGLFGTTLLTKAVASTANPSALNQAIFTTVLTFSEGNGSTINEMGLRMRNGDLYSMVTFGGITKTSSMQITFNWRLSYI